MPYIDFPAALGAFCREDVQFIVVGGLSAVLNGAPIHTYDLDIVAAKDEQNLVRLLRALEGMDAIYRVQPHRNFKPNISHLRSPGHQTLITKLGPLDVLGTVGRGLGYEDLLPHSTVMDLGTGLNVRVLDLAKLIELKEELRGEKDLAVLPILRRTLEEKLRASE